MTPVKPQQNKHDFGKQTQFAHPQCVAPQISFKTHTFPKNSKKGTLKPKKPLFFICHPHPSTNCFEKTNPILYTNTPSRIDSLCKTNPIFITNGQSQNPDSSIMQNKPNSHHQQLIAKRQQINFAKQTQS